MNAKQSYFPMSREIALSLLSAWLEPGTPSLAGLFAWVQPDDDESCMIGTVYTNLYFDQIKTERYYYNDPTLALFLHSLETLIPYSDIVFILEDCNYIYKDESGYRRIDRSAKLESTNLYEIEVHRTFDSLDESQKLFYRLAVMFVNLIGNQELHCWALGVMESLAGELVSLLEDIPAIYSNDDRNASDILLNSLFEYSDDIASESARMVSLPYDVDVNSMQELYSAHKTLEKLADDETLEWINELYDNDKIPFLEFIPHYDYEDSFQHLLAYAVDWIRLQWHDGSLQLFDSPDMPVDVREFLLVYESQELLPGFVDVDDNASEKGTNE